MDMTRKCSRDRRSLVYSFASKTMGNCQASQPTFRCCFSWKKREKNELSNIVEHIRTMDISVHRLYEVYLEKHAHDDYIFEEEFQTIPNFLELSCHAALQPNNSSKNRFVNILPFDSTRVHLSLINNDPTSDYINANFISSYRHRKKFIATQGPTPTTCEDFWRMIWELKVQSIVMLTNLMEHVSGQRKCDQYWPETNQTIVYGSYQITGLSHRCLTDYDKRSFTLVQLKSEDVTATSSTNIKEQSRLILHYHFTQWKDMDIPPYCHTLLQCLFDLNESTSLSSRHPIVVHCTAGVGRTGTFIALDAMIEKMKREGLVNIWEFIRQMRTERYFMVQTVKQYAFIHRALLESHLFGQTRIERRLFRSIFIKRKLRQPLHLTLEYQKLTLLPPEHLTSITAHSLEHIEQNRHSQLVPYDHNRLDLSHLFGSSYINATFIQGLPIHLTALIITQNPLANTIEEFWRIFLEYDTDEIVQLHTNDDDSILYFPETIQMTMEIGSICSITLIEEELIDDRFVFRRFSLLDQRENRRKLIDHFECRLPLTNNDLPEPEYCQPIMATFHMIDFLQQIQDRRQKKNSMGFITVHGGNGGPVCSLFSLSLILFYQLQQEECVDIFQTVRMIQHQRMGMITSLTQYEYLYNFINDFLDEKPNETT